MEVPSSLTEPVAVPSCPDCKTWGEAVELLLKTRSRLKQANERLRDIERWSQDNAEQDR